MFSYCGHKIKMTNVYGYVYGNMGSVEIIVCSSCLQFTLHICDFDTFRTIEILYSFLMPLVSISCVPVFSVIIARNLCAIMSQIKRRYVRIHPIPH